MKKYTITTDGLPKLTLEILSLGGSDTGCVVDGDDFSAEHYVSSRGNISIPSPELLAILRPRTTDPSSRVSIVDGDSTSDINLDALMKELDLPTLEHARKLVKHPTLGEAAARVIAAKCSDFESAQKAIESVYRSVSGLAPSDIDRVAIAALLYTHHQLGISRETIIRRVHARRLEEEHKAS